MYSAFGKDSVGAHFGINAHQELQAERLIGLERRGAHCVLDLARFETPWWGRLLNIVNLSTGNNIVFQHHTDSAVTELQSHIRDVRSTLLSRLRNKELADYLRDLCSQDSCKFNRGHYLRDTTSGMWSCPATEPATGTATVATTKPSFRTLTKSSLPAANDSTSAKSSAKSTLPAAASSAALTSAKRQLGQGVDLGVDLAGYAAKNNEYYNRAGQSCGTVAGEWGGNVRCAQHCTPKPRFDTEI
jgi:hypothetical protein